MTREYQWFDLGLGLGKALQIALIVWGLSKVENDTCVASVKTVWETVKSWK